MNAGMQGPPEVSRAGRGAGLAARLGRARKFIGIVAALGATLGGLAGYWNLYRAVRSPVTAAQAPDAAPRLSIVVLPFANLTGDPAREPFADALTEEIANELAVIRDSFVIAPGTAMTFKGRPADVRAVGRELGVRYVLEGNLLRAGAGLAVDTRLVDAGSGKVLATDNAEVASGLIEDLRIQVAGRVADTLGRDVVAIEARRVRAARASNLQAQDYRLQGRDLLQRAKSQAEYDEAYRLYGLALAADPNYEPALDGQALAIVLNLMTIPQEAKRHPERMQEAERKASAAITLDPADADPRFTLAMIRQLQGRFEEALAAADAAIERNPSLARALATRGAALTFLGKPEESIEPYRRALALSPRETRRELWFMGLCRAYLLAGRYRDSVDWCEKARAIVPADYYTNLYLAAAYAELGESDKAGAAKANVLRIVPDFRIARHAVPATNPTFDALRQKYVVPAWRKAGFADEASGP